MSGREEVEVVPRPSGRSTPQVQDGAGKAPMTDNQIDLARHALGLPNRMKRSYRNNFVAGPGHVDWDEWQMMVAAGHAVSRRWSLIPHIERVFTLTRAGATLALLPGESLDPEDFPVPTQAAAVASAEQGEGVLTPKPLNDRESRNMDCGFCDRLRLFGEVLDAFGSR